MTNRDVARAKQRVDHAFELIRSLPDEPEVQSHWARYLCVLVSGFIEAAVRSIYGQYAKDKAAPYVANYVERELEYFQNPSMGKILEIARAFSPAWETELRAASEGAPRDAVDSIVANRHNIAHGRVTGISYVQVREYYGRAVPVVELIDEQCRR